ncbi:hypothetical protein GUJ93_ZPchr0011g28420 [Zizania palustris]|uniref:Pyruvate carboxyltransferase domain-containing protein n=1 Tax=Zizania palustris TaxID=103762 RepID=A0A8J5WMC0_ZIZPA|nr:hypothetical protein GUJ93_ZPchr0011g28420 [Zizania palustris]
MASSLLSSSKPYCASANPTTTPRPHAPTLSSFRTAATRFSHGLAAAAANPSVSHRYRTLARPVRASLALRRPNTAEKLVIARQLARLGVDIIEAGFPASSPDDLDAVRSIAIEVGNTPVGKDGHVPVICGLSRCNK